MGSLTIYDFLRLIKNVNEDQISFTKHVEEKIEDRGLSCELVRNIIIYDIPVGILKQDSNKFKVYYPFPSKKLEYDLIIILAINGDTDKKVLKPVTTYQQTIKRRVRPG